MRERGALVDNRSSVLASIWKTDSFRFVYRGSACSKVVPDIKNHRFRELVARVDRIGNDAFFPVACADAGHRGQRGSGPLGAKGLLHRGKGGRARSWADWANAQEALALTRRPHHREFRMEPPRVAIGPYRKLGRLDALAFPELGKLVHSVANLRTR